MADTEQPRLAEFVALHHPLTVKKHYGELKPGFRIPNLKLQYIKLHTPIKA